MHAILIATLGSEPQVITLAVDLLLAQRTPLERVVVLHTRPALPPIATSLARLAAAFDAQPSWPLLTPVEIPTNDVLLAEELETFAEVLFHTLKQWVIAGRRIHLLLAGGRKSMAMVGIPIAQMLLSAQDHVWYLHSDESLRVSGRLQREEQDQARLISIPLPHQLSASPLYTRSFQAQSPAAARAELERAHAQRVRHFIEHELTNAERQIVALIASDVLTVAEIAARRNTQPKTVTNQLNQIYSKLESNFDLQADVGLKREFLRRELAGYFATQAGSQLP